MAILITGGAGYIGSHMVYELMDSGEPGIVVLDNLSTGFQWLLPNRIVFINGNVGDKGLVARTIEQYGIDSIIHFAASTVVPESVVEPLKYYTNNTENSLRLIECAVRSEIKRFIFSSTAAVYSSNASAPISEDGLIEPASPYGWSKLMTERILRDIAAQKDLRFAILRYFNVCGADPHLRAGQSTKNATHLIKVAIEAALGLREKIEVFGTDYPTPDGTCIRDYIHVSDLVRAHSLALHYLRASGTSEVLNCGYGRGYSVLQVIDAVKRISGRNFTVTVGPRRAGDQPKSIAASERLRSLLHWQPQFDSLDTIVTHALAWERHVPLRSSGQAQLGQQG